MTATALAVGQPISEFNIFSTEIVGHHSDAVNFEALEDSVSRSRGEVVWRPGALRFLWEEVLK